MNDAKSRAEILKLSRCEDLGTIRREGDRDAVGGDEMPELCDETGGGVRAGPVDGDPVRVAANKDKVRLGSKLEKISTD